MRYREPAVSEQPTNIGQTQGEFVRKRSYTLVASVMAISLAAVACSETKKSASSTPGTAKTTDTTPVSSTPGTSGATSTTANAAADELNKWALDYTGGTAGAATGDSIKVGYANDEDFFPENTIGIEAARDYINKELGGAAGKPIELVPCKVSTAEDGAKCGTQFANDATISVVITGTILNGNKELYDTLNGKKPVIVGNGVTSDDFTTPAGQAFTAGSPGVITGMAGFVTTGLSPTPKSVAVLAQNNAAGKAAVPLLIEPVLKKAGITSTPVFIDDTASAADVQAALKAVGADKADVLLPILTIQQCINVYDAMKSLAINPIVVTTGLCFGTPMTDHLKQAKEAGPVPDGWYFGGYGYSYFQPDLASGMKTYIAKVQQYGKPAPNAKTLEYTGFAGPEFANLMTFDKFVNTSKGAVDFTTLDAAIRAFKGPMMLQVGPLDCGKQVILGLKFFVSVCGAQMGIQLFKGGQWTSIADGLNGKPIDATKVVGG
jgi:branched-chain amino acid transport system substrate-binding protein